MFNSPIDEIKQRLDIIDVLSEYLKLKPSGSNHKACCPFHNEKTPSFMVSQEKQIYHCFGCSKGGDMFEFIQEIEGVDFPEALRILANKANVKLTRHNPEQENKKTKTMDILTETARFWQQSLLESDEGRDALKYLKEDRQLKQETIEDFKIGYADDSWDKLSKHLKQKGYQEDDIFQAGLTVKKDKGIGYYDRFRGRVMFPICDVHSNIVGFTGRILKEDPDRPGGKYVNTPQTHVFDKSRVLYGLNKAKQNIKKLGAALLVEGQMDVIMAHQQGFNNTVAASGTALTESQVNLLKRYSHNLLLSFDMDAAGLEAAKRGIAQAQEQEMNIKVMLLPEKFKDPDDCLKEDPQAFKESLKNAQNIMDYYFTVSLKGLDMGKVDDKKKAAKALLPLLIPISDPVEQSHYLKKLADLVGVPEDLLRNKLKSLNKKPLKKTPPSPDVERGAGGERKDRFSQLSERIIALAIKQSEDFKYFIDYLSPEFLSGPKLQALYKDLINYYNNKEQLNIDEFVKEYPEQQKRVGILSLLAESEFSSTSEKELQTEILNAIKSLEKNYIQNRLQALEKELASAEAQQNHQQTKVLSEEFNLLTQKLAQLL